MKPILSDSSSYPQVDYSFKTLKIYLQEKGIKICGTQHKPEHHKPLHSVAKYIGNNYTDIRPFLKKIKSHMQFGKGFELLLQPYSQTTKSAICQLGTRLQEVKLLDSYSYYKAPHSIIQAKTTTNPIAQNFLSGTWLEMYVTYLIKYMIHQKSKVQQHNIHYEIFNNIKIKLSNNEQFEFDILVLIEEDLYWIECKSNNSQKYLLKYNHIAQEHGFDIDKCYLVCSELTKNPTLPDKQSLHLCSLAGFVDTFYHALEKYNPSFLK